MAQVKWLTSVQIRKLLKLSTCDLAHIRNDGKIRFMKRGNAYLYDEHDCQVLKQESGDHAGHACPLDE